MSALIKVIEYYHPDTYLENEQISKEHPEWSVEKISAKTGIYKRPIAAEEISSGDLAYKAGEKLFSENEINKDQVDFLLFCTQSPDYFLPTTACILQDKLGLPTSTGAIDFNLGCSGYIYGLSLAQGLISSDAAKNVLFLTGETYSKFIHTKDKSNRTIFGDAASATLISKDDGIAQIGLFGLGTDGKGAENLIVRNGAFKNRKLNGEDVRNENEFLRNDNNLYMNGGEIFNFTAQSVPLLVKNTLFKNRVSFEEIDLFVFHQANKYMLNFIRKKIGIPEEKFYYFLENVGNTVSATIPIALKEALNEGRIKKGYKVLIAGFGVGYSWGATVLNF